MLQRSRKTNNEEDSIVTIPSQKILYQLLLELGQKYNRLEERIEEMNKCFVKKRKIDELEWLNTNIYPQIHFENLTEEIVITEHHVEFLLYNSFNDTLNEIFADLFCKAEKNNYIYPIFTFTHKSKNIYIYEKDNNNNNSKWVKLSNDKLTRFLQKIQIKISKTFYDWKKLHDKKIKEDDNLGSICNNATIKLMSQDFKVESKLTKIKNILLNNIKPYEFDLYQD
jgi:hypothetical protein